MKTIQLIIDNLIKLAISVAPPLIAIGIVSLVLSEKNIIFKDIFTNYIKPLIPILATLLAYFLGRSAYFRQKEYEMITKRYLEEGLDKISENVDTSLADFRHNWAHCLTVIKSFRDLGKDMRRELYTEGLIPPKPSSFELWRDYRLKDIVADNIFNSAHQSLDAFVREAYSFFLNDFCNGVRITLEGGEELEVVATREEITEGFMQEIVKFDQRARKYYVLLGELQNISHVLQTQRFSFDGLKNLKKDQTVRQAVTKLHATFKDCQSEKKAETSIGGA